MTSAPTEGFAIAGSQTSTEDGVFNANQAFGESSSCSHEQIFSPLEIKKNYESSTPGFREPFPASNSNGLFADNHLGPTIKELNPYFSAMFGDDGSDFIANNDYVVVINELAGTDGETTDLNLRKLENREDVDTVRSVGLRGPLIISGWGFDIADRPIPAKGTSGAAQYEFNPALVNNRAYWKTGPVNLMWDDERQVWCGGLQMVCGRLSFGSLGITPATDVLNPTQFEVSVLRPSGSGVGQGSLTDELGETITCTNRDASLTQENITDASGDSIVWIVAVRINYEWIPLWVGCPTEGNNGSSSTPSSTPSSPTL